MLKEAALPQRSMILISGLVAAVATAAVAATPAQLIAARQAHYKEIGKSFKAIMDELHKDSPDVAVIRPAAHTIATLTPQIPTWFPAGTGPEAGVKTGALPVIWTKNAEFKTDADKVAAAAKDLDAAAASGDVAKIKAAAMTTGGACKSCHDTFRKKES